MLEKQIEEKACRWAIEHGWLSMKFTSPSRRSVPDRLFIKEGKTVFIEFKREGGRTTSGQDREIARFRAAGARVEICYSVEEAVAVLSEYD